MAFVKSKTYDERDDFDFDIVIFPFLDDAAPRSTSYCVTISQLIRFSSSVQSQGVFKILSAAF